MGKSLSGADADEGDVRPTLLALAMLVIYGLFFVISPAREFFELASLRLEDVALLAGLAALWALLVMLFWRTQLINRAAGSLADRLLSRATGNV